MTPPAARQPVPMPDVDRIVISDPCYHHTKSGYDDKRVVVKDASALLATCRLVSPSEGAAILRGEE